MQEGQPWKKPIGKKKARQAKADAKLEMAIIAKVAVKKEKKVGGSDSVISSGESGGVIYAGAMMGDVLLQNILCVIANVERALLENMK